MPKTPNDPIEPVQDLEELYRELLVLRRRVREAEQANEKRDNAGPKTQTGNPARRKQFGGKRAR